MKRYTYKGYVLLNNGGAAGCDIFDGKTGEFLCAWPQVNWCKMMIDASIRDGGGKSFLKQCWANRGGANI